jgi:hypothetical protein
VGRVTPNSAAICATVCARRPSVPVSSYICCARATWRGQTAHTTTRGHVDQFAEQLARHRAEASAAAARADAEVGALRGQAAQLRTDLDTTRAQVEHLHRPAHRRDRTLAVLSLDRLSRSLANLITMVTDLRRRGVWFKSLHRVRPGYGGKGP